MTRDDCVFCRIVEGREPASLVHEDDECIAFLTLRQVRSGELVIIPPRHIDHFTDVPDDAAAHIMQVAQRIGRALMEYSAPERIGYIVHGYGVAHAHLIVLPQRDRDDITSARIQAGNVVFMPSDLPVRGREELDQLASNIRTWLR